MNTDYLPSWAYDGAMIVATAIIVSVTVQYLLYALQLGFAFYALRRRVPEHLDGTFWTNDTAKIMPISLLVPAFNEALNVTDSIKSLLKLQYPAFELIVINDGSTDDTLARLIENFNLSPTDRTYQTRLSHKDIRGFYASPQYPQLLVVDKANGGKADALNAGINLARYSIFCSIDADSILEPNALFRAALPFSQDPIRMAAVAGTIRVANGCTISDGTIIEHGIPKNFLAKLQSLEYLRAFLMARLGLSEAKSLLLVSGAFGLFRRHLAIQVGGYSTNTVGEDYEFTVKLHRYLLENEQDYRVVFLPEPVCWTEVPETLHALSRQRMRWQRGAIETISKHWKMAIQPRYGRPGVIGMGSSIIIDIISPTLEILGYILVPLFWTFELLNTDFLLAFFALSVGAGITLSLAALILSELELSQNSTPNEVLSLGLIAVLENFGYRQLNAFWRLSGTWQHIRKHKGWDVNKRVGFKGNKPRA